MQIQPQNSAALASAITRAASKQTYYTIRFLADRERSADAYRAYAYLRWVDDVVDAPGCCAADKLAFLARQRGLVEAAYRGETPGTRCAEEWILLDLIASDRAPDSGLSSYLRNIMEVMRFDAGRCGRVVSSRELETYTRTLARGVTDALYYFIGHADPEPSDESRYLSVTAAHLIHMLRDTVEDTQLGYYNIPREYLEARGIAPQDIAGAPYREWVCHRIQRARRCFAGGRLCLARTRNWRRRLAGYAYTARFEWMLGVIERDQYCLRADYPERRTLGAGLWMGCATLAGAFSPPPHARHASRSSQ
jgi:phytoene/squalene synthetase